MSKLGELVLLPLSLLLLPYGVGLTRGNLAAASLLYGYDMAVEIAPGCSPVGVGPGKPTTDSGGNCEGLTEAIEC